MRVGFVIYGGLHLVSGGFVYDRLLIEGLRARGMEVVVAALPWRRGLRALADNIAPWPTSLGRGACDVLVEDQLVHPSVFLRHRRLRAAGVKIVALVHNLTSRLPPERPGGWRRAVERRYFHGVDGVVAVCQSTLADVQALSPGPLPAVVARPGGDHVGATGVDDSFVSARAVESGPLRLLFAGTVMPHKGLHRLLAALVAGAPGPEWTLDVAGSLGADSGYVAALRAQVAGAGLTARLRFHGELDAGALQALYRHCQVLVLPSAREAYPLSCLEALAFGLPALVTDRGGAGEIVTSGREGWLLPPEGGAAWTAAIFRLAQDRARLAAMSVAARARSASHSRWSDTARTVGDFLQSLVQRAGVGIGSTP